MTASAFHGEFSRSQQSALRYEQGDQVVLLEPGPDDGQSWAVVERVWTNTYELFIVHSTHADYKYGDKYKTLKRRLCPYFAFLDETPDPRIAAGFERWEMEQDLACMFDLFPIDHKRELWLGAISVVRATLKLAITILLLIAMTAFMLNIMINTSVGKLMGHSMSCPMTAENEDCGGLYF